MGDEAYCDRCEAPNPPWFAPSDAWNAITGHPPGLFLCPNCFIWEAQAALPEGERLYFVVVPETWEPRVLATVADAQEVLGG